MADARVVMPTHGKISRRTWLKRIALFTSAAGAPSLFLASGNSTEVKASQSMVHYQNHPDQGQMCGMCRSFIPGGRMGRSEAMEAATCKLVEGSISRMGWCMLYAAK
jgi:hypothetical protein